MRRFTLVPVLLTLIAIALAACGGAATPAASNPVPADDAAPAANSTAVSFTPIPTFTLAPTATRIPPETLTNQELHARLNPYAPADPACTLPCYNGLIPGQSDMAGTMAFFARLGIGERDFIPGDYQAAQNGTGKLGAWLTKTSDITQAEAQGLPAPLVDLYIENGIVQNVYVAYGYTPSYLTPAAVLNQPAAPESIDLGLDVSVSPATYTLRLLYPATQSGVAFYGIASPTDAGYDICFDSDHLRRAIFGLYAPGLPLMEGIPGVDTLRPIAETASQQDFLTAVGSGGCLTLPAP